MHIFVKTTAEQLWLGSVCRSLSRQSEQWWLGSACRSSLRSSKQYGHADLCQDHCQCRTTVTWISMQIFVKTVRTIVTWNSMQISAWRSSLKTSPRPGKNWTKTGLSKDCSLGLSKFQMKDRRKTGLYGPVETGWDCSFVPLNYPFKYSPRACQLVENWLRYSIFCQMFDNYSILYWYLHIFINSGSFWMYKGSIWNLNIFLKF